MIPPETEAANRKRSAAFAGAPWLGITFLITLSSSKIIPGGLRNHHDCQSNQKRSDNNETKAAVPTDRHQNNSGQTKRSEDNPDAENHDEAARALCCLTINMSFGKERLERT